MRQYAAHSTADWPWFEDILAYDNATLPRALLLAGCSMGKPRYVKTALTALTWLLDLQCSESGYFVPIGSQGFYTRGEQRARFDQQPVEAYATVAACLDAFRCTGDAQWAKQSQLVFDWFLGRNDLSRADDRPATGACYDGLQPDGVNQNQGAESTLAFLLSLLDLRLAEEELATAELLEERADPSVANPLADGSVDTTDEATIAEESAAHPL